MAVLALAIVGNFDCNPESGGVRVQMRRIATIDGAHQSDDIWTDYFAIDPTTGAQFTADVKAWVKQWTIDTWSLTYGMTDTVRLMNSVDLE